MVDAERIDRLTNRVADDLAELSSDRERRDELLASPRSLDAVKYRFITTIEGCVRVAHHIIAAEGWSPSEDNSGAIKRLAQHGVIAADTAGSVASAVGFRNILVHEYLDVDDDEVVVNLDRLDDLRGFITQVSGWVQKVADE